MDGSGVEDQPLDGTFAGRYHILAPVGRGGLGTVYRALDTVAQRIVALKTTPKTGSDPMQLVHEAAALKKLKHPSILQIYDSGESAGVVYVALEYVDGESLAAVLARKHSLAPDVAVAIARDVALALRHAHRRAVLHRDIKPSNILIARDGRVLLSDFGIAGEPGGATLTRSGLVVGTPRYMSPEQA